MNSKNQIWLKGKGYLEMSEEFPFPLNFQVSDVKDISSKKGSFSKTIKIPGTKHNNQLLGQLFDINAYDSSFNINRKLEAKVITADQQLMDGYLKLVSVEKESQTSIQGEQKIYYTAQVFDDSTNFFDAMGNNLLEDLDMSKYDHLYSGSTIIDSNGNTYIDGYTYPQLFNSSSWRYKTTDFFPAVYMRTYLQKIAQENGYFLDFSFIESATSINNIIVPFNQEKPKNSQEVIDSRKYKVNMTGGTNGNSFYVYSGSNILEAQLLYNDDNSTGFFDSGSTFDIDSSTANYDYNGVEDFRVRTRVEFGYYASADSDLEYNGNPVPSSFRWRYDNPTIAIKQTGSTISKSAGVITGSDIYIPSSVSAGTHEIVTYNVDITLPNVDLTIGEKIAAYLQPRTRQRIGTFWNNGADVQFYVKVYTDLSSDQSSLSNEPQQTILKDGDTALMNDFIPKEVKQKEFFKWFTQMYNIYIEPDKENKQKLILKTRDQYYDTAEFVDWTKKIKLDEKGEIKFLPELQNRDLILTYKKGDDSYNKLYEENWKETYGRKKFIFDNDYLKGERKIEIGFESTPLDENGFGNVVSVIKSSEPKSGIRVLYKPDEWISGNRWYFDYINESGTKVTRSFVTYPYAGHFDRPTRPTEDINFGETRQLYYNTYGTVTDNNLGNKYYKEYVQQLLDGKLYTAYFDLNESDIADLDLSRKVFVKDAYYLINKIVDYSANKNKLTKVELIRIDTGTRFNNSNDSGGGIRRPDLPSVSLPFKPVGPDYGGGGGTVGTNPTRPYKPGNTVLSPSTDVKGDSNYVGSSSNMDVTGTGNTIVGQTSGYILGNDNYADTVNKSLIIGDNITASTTSSAISLGVSDIDITEENTTYVNNIKMTTGSTLTYGSTVLITSGGTLAASGGSSVDEVFVSGSSGSYSIQQKNATAIATGDYSLAGGYLAESAGDYSFNWGYDNESRTGGNYAVSFGRANTNFAEFAATFGFNNTNYGTASLIAGQDNIIESSSNHTHIIGRGSNIEGSATGSIIFGQYSTIKVSCVNSIVLGTQAFINANRSVTIGGTGLSATTDDTVYVPGFNIRDIGTGTSVSNLGIDANGYVVTGSASGGSTTGTTKDSIGVAASDETTVITTGPSKVTIRAPYDFELTGITAYVITSGSTDSQFDVNLNGTTLLSSPITLPSGEYVTATTAIASSTLVKDDEISFDIDTAGTGAAGLKFWLNGTVVQTILTAPANPYDFVASISDETTQITSGSTKLTFYATRDFDITKVKFSLSTAGSTTSTIDLNVNGSTILTSPIDLASGEFIASTTGLTTTTILEDDKFTVDIDSAGTGAAGAKVYIQGETNN